MDNNNNSSTGGYLAPEATPDPLYDDALEDFLQAVVAGISGLPGASVFPRWQPDVPNQPNFPDSWAALGITRFTADTYAYIGHDGDGQGSDMLGRGESLEILCSFYGPQAGSYMAAFRDGIQIPQNREVMWLAGFGLTETGEAVQIPSLVKTRWVKRIDLPWRVRRTILRTYPVLNITSAGLEIVTDVGIGPVPVVIQQT